MCVSPRPGRAGEREQQPAAAVTSVVEREPGQSVQWVVSGPQSVSVRGRLQLSSQLPPQHSSPHLPSYIQYTIYNISQPHTSHLTIKWPAVSKVKPRQGSVLVNSGDWREWERERGWSLLQPSVGWGTNVTLEHSVCLECGIINGASKHHLRAGTLWLSFSHS